MIAVYLAMLETDVDRDKFMKLYESYEKKLFAMVRGICEWNKNNHSPKLSVPAKVVSRRTAVSHHHHHQGNGMHHTHTATSYYATFQVESGDRIEFLVSGTEYGMLAEGDSGELTFQGTRYLNFRREGAE